MYYNFIKNLIKLFSNKKISGGLAFGGLICFFILAAVFWFLTTFDFSKKTDPNDTTKKIDELNNLGNFFFVLMWICIIVFGLIFISLLSPDFYNFWLVNLIVEFVFNLPKIFYLSFCLIFLDGDNCD